MNGIILYIKVMILMHLYQYTYIASIMVAVISWGYALYGHLLLNICKYLIGNKVIKTNNKDDTISFNCFRYFIFSLVIKC